MKRFNQILFIIVLTAFSSSLALAEPPQVDIPTEADLEAKLTTWNAFQFERVGYFTVDAKDSNDGKPVFNRTVTLRDSWAKIEKAERGA